METVVLVDRSDRRLGVEEKLTAHREGRLHRAFSVFLFDAEDHLLLQRRADGKYHSGRLWSNTCCSHPRPDEPVQEAAERRLREEMGLRCRLRTVGAFVYRASVGGGLREHEFDHVLVGRQSGEPSPDPREVSAWRTVPLADVRGELRRRPAAFTPWFRPALERVLGRSLAV